MSQNKIKVVAAAEALGLLDPPKVKRRYWVVDTPTNIQMVRK